MNCLEYRRLMEAAPGEAGPEAIGHARTCPACAEFGKRAGAADRTLRAAARIPVPEKLEARILMRQSFPHRSGRRKLRRAWPALAASLLVALVLGLYLGHSAYREAGLHQELVALVKAADYALQAEGTVDGQAVSDALGPVGLALDEQLGSVSFAGRCLVRGNLSGHLVIRESAIPVTVFLMPYEHVSRKSSFEQDGWRGVVIPAAQGTVGLVVPVGSEPVDEKLVDRVVRSVRWRA